MNDMLWLGEANAKLNTIERKDPSIAAWIKPRADYCRKILMCIEAENIKTPEIWADRDFPRKIIHMRFVNAGKSLEFFVSYANSFHALKSGGPEGSTNLVRTGWPGNNVRQLFGWLYPDNNLWPVGDVIALAGKVSG